MMRSTYNNNANGDDEDDFAPNPFRSGGGGGISTTGSMDFFETPTPINTMNNMNYSQPDPNTGMVGSVPPPPMQQQQQPQQFYAHPPPQQQSMYPNSPYLTGTMDQLGGNNSNNKAPTPPGSAPSNNIFYSFLTSCCLPYETIQSLFDIDTVDIYVRIKATLLHFHQPNYFRLQILGTKRNTSDTTGSGGADDPTDLDVDGLSHHHKGPDLYGPIWISMTCMFILGITANINDYYRHVQKQQHNNHYNNNNNHTNSNSNTIEEEFEYDLTHLLNAMYICFIYTFGISTFFWLVCICMGFNNGQHNNNTSSSSKYLSWIYWVCHYGYSLVPILIGTCVAWILPYTLFHWIVLATATFISSLFIIRNLSTPLLEQEMMVVSNDPTNGTFTNNTTTTTTSTHAKAAPILLSILGVHFTFLLVLKLTFYP